MLFRALILGSTTHHNTHTLKIRDRFRLENTAHYSRYQKNFCKIAKSAEKQYRWSKKCNVLGLKIMEKVLYNPVLLHFATFLSLLGPAPAGFASALATVIVREILVLVFDQLETRWDVGNLVAPCKGGKELLTFRLLHPLFDKIGDSRCTFVRHLHRQRQIGVPVSGRISVALATVKLRVS